MELRNRIVINSLIGIIAGMIVGITSWMLSGDPGDRSFVLHMIASAIHGLIPCGAMAVYGIESWGLTKSTVVHASITLATILLIELPMKWFTWSVDFAIAMVIYVILYTIIWLVNYLYWKHTVNEMNDQLEVFLRNRTKQ